MAFLSYPLFTCLMNNTNVAIFDKDIDIDRLELGDQICTNDFLNKPFGVITNIIRNNEKKVNYVEYIDYGFYRHIENLGFINPKIQYAKVMVNNEKIEQSNKDSLYDIIGSLDNETEKIRLVNSYIEYFREIYESSIFHVYKEKELILSIEAKAKAIALLTDEVNIGNIWKFNREYPRRNVSIEENVSSFLFNSFQDGMLSEEKLKRFLKEVCNLARGQYLESDLEKDIPIVDLANEIKIFALNMSVSNIDEYGFDNLSEIEIIVLNIIFGISTLLISAVDYYNGTNQNLISSDRIDLINKVLTFYKLIKEINNHDTSDLFTEYINNLELDPEDFAVIIFKVLNATWANDILKKQVIDIKNILKNIYYENHHNIGTIDSINEYLIKAFRFLRHLIHDYD